MGKKAWYLGNTTVRNAKRLKDGLRVLNASSFNGNLEGNENEQNFARQLHESGVVYISRLEEDETKDVSDLGRKWRAALMQLGFITHAKDNNPYTITENGKRLVNATNLPLEQEVFLRSLLAYQLPSVIEPKFPSDTVFNPLRIVLEILNELKNQELEVKITKDEMASFVEVTTDIHQVKNTVNEIKKFREKLSSIKGPDRKRFLVETREKAASNLTIKPDTLVDYADSNFRYLKLTGLFTENANSLKIAKHKEEIFKQIVNEPWKPFLDENYLDSLWNGAHLPTDNTSKAIEAIKYTNTLITQETKEDIQLPDLNTLDDQALATLRISLESKWLEILEKLFATDQVNSWKDILEYLRALTKPIKGKSKIPQGEGPSYFEWTLWRAFLAINHLTNEPWECRNFKVDEEFYPLGHAAGGGSDLIFEFEDFVIVGEVTLSKSSRQEAMEGAPVRKHVADIVELYEKEQKPVYGLFMANTIDTNTAETFRLGIWYGKDDKKINVNILPLTIEQFISLFENGFVDKKRIITPQLFEELIQECRKNCSLIDAPTWKKSIEEKISYFSEKLKADAYISN